MYSVFKISQSTNFRLCLILMCNLRRDLNMNLKSHGRHDIDLILWEKRYWEKIFTTPYVFTSLEMWHCRLCYYFVTNKYHFNCKLCGKVLMAPIFTLGTGIPSCLDYWWVLSWVCRVAWYSHWLHEYLTPLCLDCWWVLKLPCNVAWYSH